MMSICIIILQELTVTGRCKKPVDLLTNNNTYVSLCVIYPITQHAKKNKCNDRWNIMHFNVN